MSFEWKPAVSGPGICGNCKRKIALFLLFEKKMFVFFILFAITAISCMGA